MLILNIEPNELERHFIGAGDEGRVYRHRRKYAVKIFSNYYSKKKCLENKMAKVADMTRIQDPSFAFPIGLVSTDGETSTGYFTKYIDGKKSFKDLSLSFNKEKILTLLLEAEAALKRIHKKGIMVGDLREDNILLNEENHPIYIDTDNYCCGNHSFDMVPLRAGCLYDLYGGKFANLQDNDKLLFALMSLEIITKDPRFKYGASKEDITQALKEHSVSREVREVLDCIFSDAERKPYIGPVLQKISNYISNKG